MAPGGGGRWSSRSGETAVRAEQHAAREGSMGPRGNGSMLWRWG
jgi:hypothetical protein